MADAPTPPPARPKRAPAKRASKAATPAPVVPDAARSRVGAAVSSPPPAAPLSPVGHPVPAAPAAAPAPSGPAGAADAAIAATTRTVRLPLLGEITLPPANHLAWYGGVALLTALEIVEWPVALVLAAGKALADNHTNASLQAFGEALEDAG